MWLLVAPLAACRRDSRIPLVLYSPHGRDLLGLVERTYEAKHPDVDVRWLDMGSQEVYDRVRSEKANPQADVWFGGPNTIFARGVRDDLLEPYRPSWAAAIPPESRQRRDLFFGVYRTPAVLVYTSGTMRAIFGMILARSISETGSPERGFQWLSRLDAQTKEYVMNASVLVEKVARREGLVTVWDLPDVL